MDEDTAISGRRRASAYGVMRESKIQLPANTPSRGEPTRSTTKTIANVVLSIRCTAATAADALRRRAMTALVAMLAEDNAAGASRLLLDPSTISRTIDLRFTAVPATAPASRRSS